MPGAATLTTTLRQAAAAATPGPVGGIFNGTRMWAAVVNRDGRICACATSTSDLSQVWPGSQSIAKAKAYTANAFLGVSGDTSCADHEMAKRTGHLVALDPPGGPFVDEISYSSVDGASAFTHPLCLSTYRTACLSGTKSGQVRFA